MWKYIVVLFSAASISLNGTSRCLSETTNLRGNQREKVIDKYATEYFNEIYIDILLLSEKYNNYSFYEYGCIPLRPGMIDNIYMGHGTNECDFHKENINYYTNIFLKNKNDIYQSRYSLDIKEILKNKDDYIRHNINTMDITLGVLKKINETFLNIKVNNKRRDCCNEYYVEW
jgi:hypothetical protein